MPMKPDFLESTLQSLAATFTQKLIEALSRSTLDDLLEISGEAEWVNKKRTSGVLIPGKPARLARRSPEAIAELLTKVVTLLGHHSEGLRAEVIRTELGLQAKELPRIFREGTATNVLQCTGEKRATTYFVGRKAKRASKKAKKDQGSSKKSSSRQGPDWATERR
jgi:hypothetical protein